MIYHFSPASVGAGTGVEQSACRADEGLGARAIESEVSREAEIRECVPIAGSTRRGGTGGIACQQVAHRDLIRNEGGSVDTARRDVRVLSDDHLGPMQRSRAVALTRHASSFDECTGGIGEQADLTLQPNDLDVAGELRPAFEAVLAGNDQLRIGEPEPRGADGILWLVVEPRMMTRDAIESARRGSRVSAEEIPALLSVLFQVRLIG